MTAKDVLIAARALIADEERWIKGADALADRTLEPDENALAPTDPDATCWCAGGAVERIGIDAGEVLYTALRALTKVMGESFVSVFNDKPSTTHADVLAAFDKAIAAQGDD